MSLPTCLVSRETQALFLSSFLSVRRDLWPRQLSAKFPKAITILQIPAILRTPSRGNFTFLKAAALQMPGTMLYVKQWKWRIKEYKQLSLPSRTSWSKWRQNTYTWKQFHLKVWGSAQKIAYKAIIIMMIIHNEVLYLSIYGQLL